MEYNFSDIEKKWQQQWKDSGVYKVPNNADKPKCYVLDMFPYPSGAGLHVGHPLGYIASDIYARFKRLKGFNVLHTMGYDSFGLPAEQYALETGQHPAVTTEKNIATFRSQLDKIGFCFDWSREVKTSDPAYYKWTQWIFLQLFNSYFDKAAQKAKPIADLIKSFETEGSARSSQLTAHSFSASEWNAYDEKSQQDILMQHRLAFSAYGEVNWCEALGTVLANDEVVNGVSERGGHPVVKKQMRQWYLRITAYADRLLEGLETVAFSESMKEMQRNWIGKSQGAEISFALIPGPSPQVEKGGAEIGAKGAALVPKYKVGSPMQYELAKRMRKEFTEAEDHLWERLRNNQLGVKFRRQHPIENYIADFISLQHSLIVEVDGGYHETLEQKQYDDERTRVLNEIGFTIIRFNNDEVLKDIEKVIEKIISSPSLLHGVEKGDAEIAAMIEVDKKSFEASFSKDIIQGSELSHPSPLGENGPGVRVYTTRPDTIFGVDFMVIAPEHDLVQKITTPEQKDAIEKYLTYVKSRSERERMSEVKQVTGCFTGAYALNPFDGRKIPVWIAEYVLAGYGTGAIMAVPCGDQRDFTFAKHFGIPITNIIGDAYNGEEANPTKDAILENSGFINGMLMKDAINVVIDKLEEMGIGKRKVNYRMRDAGFSRQRYWGEPFPIVWKDGIAYPLDEKDLPLELPHVEKYGPGPEGEGPLANIKEWTSSPALLHGLEKGAAKTESKIDATEKITGTSSSEENLESSELSHPSPLADEGQGVRETSTMPGYAGSSWYFLRYMDPHNDQTFCDRRVSDYWNQVDLYVGGTEHAVGHLLYSRMWTKVLFDLDLIGFDEPFKKLLNQGMITGISEKILRAATGNINEPSESGNANSITSSSTSILINWKSNEMDKIFHFEDGEFYIINYSSELKGFSAFGESEINVPVEFVSNGVLNVEDYCKAKALNQTAISYEAFLCREGYYNSKLSKWFNFESEEIKPLEFRTIQVVEKMSKSKRNVVNPDDIITKFGADTFRMYEMFLGPVEASKPWDTKGIEGVHRFLKKLWRLFNDELKGKIWSDEAPTDAELKILHKTIKKIEGDTEHFAFNTAVSAFMVCVNELTDLKCHKKAVLEQLLVLLTPYAPHICEELWSGLGNNGSVLDANYPVFDEKYLVESEKEYPVSVNGKLRTTINMPTGIEQADVEKMVLANDVIQKWLEGKAPKKIIFVKNKMVNVVV